MAKKTKQDAEKALPEKLDLGDFEVRADFIKNTESSLYGGKNEEGEDVLVSLEKGEGMEVRTFQDNGWLRVNYYNAEGYSDGETFEGRWR